MAIEKSSIQTKISAVKNETRTKGITKDVIAEIFTLLLDFLGEQDVNANLGKTNLSQSAEDRTYTIPSGNFLSFTNGLQSILSLNKDSIRISPAERVSLLSKAIDLLASDKINISAVKTTVKGQVALENLVEYPDGDNSYYVVVVENYTGNVAYKKISSFGSGSNPVTQNLQGVTDTGNSTTRTIVCARAVNSNEVVTLGQVNELMANSEKLEKKIVDDELPAIGDAKLIYLVPKRDGGGNDLYDEYMWMGNSYEFIGSTATDMTDYYRKNETYSRSDIDLLLSKKVTAVAGMGLSANNFDNDYKRKVDLLSSAAPVTQDLQLITDNGNSTTKTIVCARAINSNEVVTLGQVNELMANSERLEKIIVEELPAVGEDKYIYFVPKESENGTDLYDEYMWMGTLYEFIGSTSTDMTDYYKKTETYSRPELDILLTQKVERVEGKGLSTNDYSNEDKQLVGSISDKVDKVAGKALSTNDYTDEDKQKVGTISGKVDKVAGKGLSTNDYSNEDKQLVGSISGKVDKVAGKGLSTHDFDEEYKQKVDILSPFKVVTQTIFANQTIINENKCICFARCSQDLNKASILEAELEISFASYKFIYQVVCMNHGYPSIVCNGNRNITGGNFIKQIGILTIGQERYFGFIFYPSVAEQEVTFKIKVKNNSGGIDIISTLTSQDITGSGRKWIGDAAHRLMMVRDSSGDVFNDHDFITKKYFDQNKDVLSVRIDRPQGSNGFSGWMTLGIFEGHSNFVNGKIEINAIGRSYTQSFQLEYAISFVKSGDYYTQIADADLRITSGTDASIVTKARLILAPDNSELICLDIFIDPYFIEYLQVDKITSSGNDTLNVQSIMQSASGANPSNMPIKEIDLTRYFNPGSSYGLAAGGWDSQSLTQRIEGIKFDNFEQIEFRLPAPTNPENARAFYDAGLYIADGEQIFDDEGNFVDGSIVFGCLNIPQIDIDVFIKFN